MKATEEERILAEIRWYGKTLAGGGPMGGYAQAAKRAIDRWYIITLPLLQSLDAVYGPRELVGCLFCKGQGYRIEAACTNCAGSGMVQPENQSSS